VLFKAHKVEWKITDPHKLQFTTFKMIFSTIGVTLLTFSTILHCSSAREAPGDSDRTCRIGRNLLLRDFPDNWEVLADSYDYINLFRVTPGTPQEIPAWGSRNVDQDFWKVAT
jgi:hypothetical protein